MFYAVGHTRGTGCLEGENVLLSAGTAYGLTTRHGFNIHVPDDPENVIVDSGGFQAVTRWGLEYPYTWEDYFEWAESVGADYAALPDFACEPELHASTPSDRIYHSVLNQWEAIQVFNRGDWNFQPLPVLQGYTPEDYRRCCDMMRQNDLLRDYMAVGTVCKRDSIDSIHSVLSALEGEIPHVEFHLFGLTLQAWKDRRLWGRFRSADTAAWTWGVSKDDRDEAYEKYNIRVNEIRSRINQQATLAGGSPQ